MIITQVPQLNYSRACSSGSCKQVLVPWGPNAQKQLWLYWNVFTAFTLKTKCQRSLLSWHVKPVNHLQYMKYSTWASWKSGFKKKRKSIARHSKLCEPWSRITSSMGEQTVIWTPGHERTRGLEAKLQGDQSVKLKKWNFQRFFFLDFWNPQKNPLKFCAIVGSFSIHLSWRASAVRCHTG